jgi:hypothetical protein
MASLSETFENYILARKQQWILISPYEEVFLDCNISYAEREQIVIDFLTNLENPKSIDLTNLTYSNPRFWDCIVPYPDKTHIDKLISDSFDSNKLLAEQLSWNYVWPEVSEDMVNLIKAQNELNAEYQSVVDELTQDFNVWKITNKELNEKIASERAKLDEAIQNLLSQSEVISEQIAENSRNLDTNWMVVANQWTGNTKVIVICIATVLILLWVFTMFYVVKKTKNEKND